MYCKLSSQYTGKKMNKESETLTRRERKNKQKKCPPFRSQNRSCNRIGDFKAAITSANWGFATCQLVFRGRYLLGAVWLHVIFRIIIRLWVSLERKKEKKMYRIFASIICEIRVWIYIPIYEFLLLLFIGSCWW